MSLAQRVNASPATCLRRVKRLRELGVIERDVALLSQEKLAPATGLGLTALTEVTLKVLPAPPESLTLAWTGLEADGGERIIGKVHPAIVEAPRPPRPWRACAGS